MSRIGWLSSGRGRTGLVGWGFAIHLGPRLTMVYLSVQFLSRHVLVGIVRCVEYDMALTMEVNCHVEGTIVRHLKLDIIILAQAQWRTRISSIGQNDWSGHPSHSPVGPGQGNREEHSRSLCPLSKTQGQQRHGTDRKGHSDSRTVDRSKSGYRCCTTSGGMFQSLYTRPEAQLDRPVHGSGAG